MGIGTNNTSKCIQQGFQDSSTGFSAITMHIKNLYRPSRSNSFLYKDVCNIPKHHLHLCVCIHPDSKDHDIIRSSDHASAFVSISSKQKPTQPCMPHAGTKHTFCQHLETSTHGLSEIIHVKPLAMLLFLVVLVHQPSQLQVQVHCCGLLHRASVVLHHNAALDHVQVYNL